MEGPTFREMWERSELLHEKTEQRLRRLEVVVALLVVYAAPRR
jgi:hypothetical protein